MQYIGNEKSSLGLKCWVYRANSTTISKLNSGHAQWQVNVLLVFRYL